MQMPYAQINKSMIYCLIMAFFLISILAKGEQSVVIVDKLWQMEIDISREIILWYWWNPFMIPYLLVKFEAIWFWISKLSRKYSNSLRIYQIEWQLDDCRFIYHMYQIREIYNQSCFYFFLSVACFVLFLVCANVHVCVCSLWFLGVVQSTICSYFSLKQNFLLKQNRFVDNTNKMCWIKLHVTSNTDIQFNQFGDVVHIQQVIWPIRNNKTLPHNTGTLSNLLNSHIYLIFPIIVHV